MGPPPPPLWRAARLLRLLGYVALAVLVAFVGSAIYFAAHARPSIDPGSDSAVLVASNSTVEITVGLNLSNPGAYAITGVGISAQVRLPDGGLAARGGSPIVTVAPGSTATVPVRIWMALNAESDLLLTHDVHLVESFWANATFASLFTLQVNDTQNRSWGAPFYQFNATPGTPVPEANGTVLVPVTMSWQDSAPFGETGSLLLQVLSSSHAVCGTYTVPVDVAAGGPADLSTAFYLSGSCDPSGGTVVATFTGNGLDYTFPPEAIP